MTFGHGTRGRCHTAVVTAICALALALPGPAAIAAGPPALAPSDVALVTIGATATVSLHGKVHNLGDIGQVLETVAATPSGELVIGDNILKLITPAGSVKVLSGTTTVDGFAVSPNGRYVAWSVSPGGYRAKVIYKLYLYDLATRRIVHSRTMKAQVQPVGFLDDGRVAVSGDAYDQSYLWTPKTGKLAKVGARPLPGLTHAAGHLLVMSDEEGGCSALVKDSRTGKSAAFDHAVPCEGLEELSPDGTRWLAGMLYGINDELVMLPDAADALTGKLDQRLGRLLLHQKTSMLDGVWLDPVHVLLIAERFGGVGKVGRQLELRCTVPVHADPSCATVQDLGPYLRQAGGNGAEYGPDVWIAHQLGQ
ncbi:hypothetical protein acdb102_37360 [Acidothermaceae bacterium B102]|nr:hypothetical protein acdb102_37360 [Acidothermaceae bacterium B102]